MARQQKDFTYDNNLLLKDAGLVAASAAATVSAAAKVLDVGGSNPSRVDMRVIVDASAIEADSANELFTILVQFSNSSTFASGIFNGPAILLGVAGTTLESASTAAGRREIGVTNELNGVCYRYMRLYTIVAGTIATGVNYSAFCVQTATAA